MDSGPTLSRWSTTSPKIPSLGGTAFTAVETGVIKGGTAALNFAMVGLAWEIGVGAGSIISAAILPY